MFSFDDPSPQILEHNIDWGEAQEKYPHSYMIVINRHLIGTKLHGDIIGILTPEEYDFLEKPVPFLPKYCIWEGVAVMGKGLGVYVL